MYRLLRLLSLPYKFVIFLATIQLVLGVIAAKYEDHDLLRIQAVICTAIILNVIISIALTRKQAKDQKK